MASTIKRILDHLLNDHNSCNYVSDYMDGVGFYIDYLLSTVTDRYEWDGLPDTIDPYVLESMLIKFGSIIITEKKNDLWIQPLNGYGVGVYKNRPPKGIIANPILGGYNYDLEWYGSDESAICFENPNQYTMMNVINRTAKQLARTESTIDIIMTNNNGTNITVANDGKIRDELERIYQARRDGKIVVGASKNVMEILGSSWADMQNNPYRPEILPLITAFNNQLRIFYRRFGINISKDKNQAILSDETEIDTSFTNHILDRGLKCRLKFINILKEKYGIDASVKIAEWLSPEKIEIMKEDNEDNEEMRNNNEI